MKKSNEILVELRDESLDDYLEKLDSKELDLLYEQAIMISGEKQKKNIHKRDKIDIVFDSIISNVLASSIMLVDEEIAQLKDILMGNKISFISEKFIVSNFVFKEGVDGKVNYFIPIEIKEIIEDKIINNDNSDDKKEFVIDFYLGANGIIKFDTMVDLVKGCGFNFNICELKDIVSSKEYMVENDKIYYNQFAYDLDKELDFMKIKEENDYRVFKMDEMLAIIMLKGMLVSNMKKIFSKKIKDNDKLIQVIKEIFEIVCSNSEYEEDIIIYLDENKIELTDKETDKLMESLLQVYIMMPSWQLNGNIPGHYDHDCDCGCDEDWDYDWNSEFEDLTKEEKTEVLVNAYLLINGVMRIKDMMELLGLHHGLKVKKSEIVNAVKELDDVNIINDYIHIYGLGMEEIEMLMSQKDEFGQYKIIENIDLFFDEYDEVLEELEDICIDYDLDGDVYMQVRSVLNMMGILPEEVFDAILNDTKFKMNNKRKLAFIKDIKKVSSKMRVWFLNGFSANELREMNNDTRDKIGRNEMCPCGSGKKYKKCCGR